MDVWNTFLHGSLPYQDYWAPVGMGMAAGTLCLFVCHRVWRGSNPKPAPRPAPAVCTHDPFEQGSLAEKRKSLRRPGNPIEVLIASPISKRSPHRAVVLDRSIGGLRLGAEVQMAAGTRLAVLAVNAPQPTPWVEIDVCACNRVEDYWEIGCQFVKTPPWSILLLFG